MKSLKDLVNEIHVYIGSLRGLSADDFPGWLAHRSSISNLAMRDVYYICLGRLPEKVEPARQHYASREECASHIMECLLSSEFRERLPELLFAVLPDLARHFFIHIPRTGGTTLRRLTENGHGLLAWNEGYTQDDWADYDRNLFGADGTRFMLRFLAQFAGPAPATFFYTGHVTLENLLARRLIRPHDRSLVVVRDPIEMILSAINYILTVAQGAARTPDAIAWAAWLRELAPDWRPGKAVSPDLIARLAGSERFRLDYADMMTRFLSIDGTVEGALAAIEIAGCTVIGVDGIAAYARDVLGIAAPVGHDNASTDAVACSGGVTPETRAIIEAMSVRDVELMRRLPMSPRSRDG